MITPDEAKTRSRQFHEVQIKEWEKKIDDALSQWDFDDRCIVPVDGMNALVREVIVEKYGSVWQVFTGNTDQQGAFLVFRSPQ